MKLLTVLAATAVAAAVAAALSIPAGADQSAGGEATKLASCLHARGVSDAPSGTDALALKRWLATHAESPAVAACHPQSAAPAGLMSCLRAHGLNPPDNLFQLKPWLVRQAGTDAGKAVLEACRVSFDAPEGPATGKPLAACLRSNGADVPAGADGLALKTWIRDHSSDTKVMDALERCGAGMDKAPAMAKDCGGPGAGAPAQKPDGGATPIPQPR